MGFSLDFLRILNYEVLFYKSHNYILQLILFEGDLPSPLSNPLCREV